MFKTHTVAFEFFLFLVQFEPSSPDLDNFDYMDLYLPTLRPAARAARWRNEADTQTEEVSDPRQRISASELPRQFIENEESLGKF